MSIYCTYLTLYAGNLLPPFYIGSSSVEKVRVGYRGSVSSKQYRAIWKAELEDNPQLFTTRIVSRHETRTEAVQRENDLQRKLKVVERSMYMNMAYATAGFVTQGPLNQEHRAKIAKARTGLKHSVETRKKMSESHLGSSMPTRSEAWANKQRAANLGKKASPETKAKMSSARLGGKRSPETKAKMKAAALARWATSR